MEARVSFWRVQYGKPRDLCFVVGMMAKSCIGLATAEIRVTFLRGSGALLSATVEEALSPLLLRGEAERSSAWRERGEVLLKSC